MERGLRETVASSVVHGKVRDVLRRLKELPSDPDSQTLEIVGSVILHHYSIDFGVPTEISENWQWISPSNYKISYKTGNRFGQTVE